MAERAPKRDSTAGREGDPEDGPSESKRPRIEEINETKDPGKKAYQKLNKTLKQLTALVDKPDKNEEVVERMRSLMKDLEAVCTSSTEDGETPNPLKIIQMHLKHKLFKSENVMDGDNIKNFLSGLEDGSASKSDSDENVYVFLANFATELWYSWNESEGQWQWTPEEYTEERKWWLWMPCSTTTVTAGQWEGEIPAPENVEIITYLDAVRPVPTDGSYLPSSYDIVDLLSKLLAVEDAGIVESTKTVLEKLLAQEVKSKSSHVEAFKGEITKMLSTKSEDSSKS